jgi:hypothetical protein
LSRETDVFGCGNCKVEKSLDVGYIKKAMPYYDDMAKKQARNDIYMLL